MNANAQKMQSGAMSDNELLNFEMRSCVTKRRYRLQPSCRMDQYAYACPFCDGWHRATKPSAYGASKTAQAEERK